eukprot:m.134259 g.134259  ORF g.134259 m.134259 type:complete len:427 (+) comp9539_c0_seq1:108-1388(+)
MSVIESRKSSEVNFEKEVKLSAPITEPFTWEKLQDIIAAGEFTLFGRSKEMLDKYKAWRNRVTLLFETTTDHIANAVFAWELVQNETGLFKVVYPNAQRNRYVFRPNSFPYHVEDGIFHYVLWAENGVLSKEAIEHELSVQIPGHPYLYFVNPPERQTIPRLKHCHVFWKSLEKRTPRAKIEVCVDSVASAKSAIEGGAHRLELCSALSEGGLTPSFGLAKSVIRHSTVPVFALIRPRGGDFLYTDDEVEVMCEDIRMLDKAGVDGFVIGALKRDGTVAVCVVKKLMAECGDKPVVFHRAFDMSRDPMEALEVISSLGIKRILTSGCASSCMEGIPLLAKLVSAAHKYNITVMPGGGISEDNVAEIVDKTGASEIHCSARAVFKSNMLFRRQDVHMSSIVVKCDSEFETKLASSDRVRAIISSLDN